MRWKLLIAASLLAATVGAGAVLAVTYFALGPAGGDATPPGWLLAVAVLVPLGAVAYAAVFVYRHTARRRTLQAAATALASIALTLAALLAVPYLFAPRPSPPTDVPPAKNVGQLKKR
jgi:hypothetical protein